MTCDIVALVRNQPDVRTVIEGMVAFGEQLEQRDVAGGVTQLYDSSGRLLVSIEVPVLVKVTGEVGRLLGSDQETRAEPPLWWVDIRAAAGLPDAARIARKFADDLVHWQGGVVWTGAVAPPQAPPQPPSPPAGGGVRS
ncbi:MAG TPA: hypothetical protein VH912_22940 [Streptosporangiaceae bacterium]|jgi:hypothetical protein